MYPTLSYPLRHARTVKIAILQIVTVIIIITGFAIWHGLIWEYRRQVNPMTIEWIQVGDLPPTMTSAGK